MKKLIAFVFLILISFIDVNAKVYPYDIGHIFASYYGTTSPTQTISLSNGSNTSTIEIYNDNPTKYESYLYFHVMVCRHGNDLYVSSSPYSNSGKIVNGIVYNSDDDCNDGYPGKISYIQYQISQWGTNDNWLTAFANGYSTIQGQNYVFVLAKYYSDEDIVNQLIENKMSTDLIRQQINQSITNTQNIINSQNDINNSINNDNVDSPNNALTNLNSYLATNSTISNLIILPITLFQKVLTSLNGTCSSYDLGDYNGNHIILPCINISNYIGSTLFNVIDVLISGLCIYKISRKFIAVFHNLSSMKDGDVISD